MRVSRGEVWRVNFEPRLGHEQGDIRPALVLSIDDLNHHARLSIVLPITKTQKTLVSWLPLHPPEGGVRKTSNILCDQIRVVSHERFIERLGEVSRHTLFEAERLVRYILGFT